MAVPAREPVREDPQGAYETAYAAQIAEQQRTTSLISDTLRDVEGTFKQAGETFDRNELEELVRTPPENPGFPYIMFVLALAKDVLDAFLTATIVGIVLAMFLGLVFGLILAVWSFGKMSGGWWKRRLIRWLMVRASLVVLVEFMPGFQLVPANALFVWMVHNREKKVVQLFDSALETMRARGVMKYLK